MIIVTRFLCYILLSLCSLSVWANFTVYPISKDLEAESSEVIKIISKSKPPLYINVYVKKVFNPGTENEYEEVVSNWNESELIVSPKKIIVPGGGIKAVRLTQLVPPSSEELYRVYFESVQGEGDDTSGHEGKKLSTNISVNIVYGALVRVMPSQKKTEMKVEKGIDDNIIVNNTGNVHIGIKKYDSVKKHLRMNHV